MPKDTKDDEQKTERFNMFMSPSEMKAIDEWAWESRIRSKSEAVRRLCQIGLICEEPAFTAGDATSDLLERAKDHHNSIVDLQNRVRRGQEMDMWQVLEKLSEATLDLHERLEQLQLLCQSTANQVGELTSEDPIDEGLDLARDWRERAAAHLTRIKRKHTRRKK